MNCTRCQNSGFLNLEQVPEAVLKSFDETGDHGVILEWISEMKRARDRSGCQCHISPPCYSCVEYVHDVQVCDCCGDGEDWYGEPGQHFRGADEPHAECA